MSGRKDFLNQPAPENYVAGLGRGATGFTTRSDLGPAKEGPTPEQFQEALAKRAAALGTSVSSVYALNRGEKGKSEAQKAAAEDDDDERFQDPENEVGLFAYGQYDREDDEADRIYQAVDERMERRRKLRRLVCFFVPSPFFTTSVHHIFRLRSQLDRLPTIYAIFTLGKLENDRREKNTNETIPRFNNSLPT